MDTAPTEALPKGVRAKHGRYYLVRRQRWHPLSRIEDGPGELAKALAALEGDASKPRTYGNVFLRYLAGGLLELKPASQPEYRRIIEGRLMHHFGHMALGTLKPTHAAQYLELRKTEGAPVGGNREKAVLGAVCAWAMRFGWLEDNPCHGVRRNRETPSRRYVEHDELSTAIDRASGPLADLLAVAYLTGLRQTDLVLLTPAALTRDGIELVQSKDGKHRLVEWTPTLRHFIERALAHSQKWAHQDRVFLSPRGRPWGVWTIQSAMRRLGPGFTLRQLRPKAASDASHNVLGHDANMRRVYVRAQRLRPVK